MKQAVIPGGHLDALTQDEARELLEGFFQKATEERVRAAATVALDGTGSGQDEVYLCPIGFEFEARRITVEMQGASDPNTGAVVLSGGVTQTDVDNSATGAAAAITATLPGAAGATTFITGFEVTGSGATAGSVIVVTVTGILGGTKSYELVIPAGVGVSITPLVVEFSRPIPASAVNTAISVQVPSFGAGNTNAAVTVHGFQQVATGSGKSLRLLRSGAPVEWLAPTFGGVVQVPGTESWGDEQGPYVRNGEVLEVAAKGLTPNVNLDVLIEGIQRRLPGPQGTAS